MKKEVFVIKHRISHEIDQCNIRATSTSCSSKEDEVKLTRSKSTGAQNPNRRRYSRSKRSFDFDLNTRINNANQDYDDNDDDAFDRQTEVTISTRTSSSRRREERRCSSKERRISISPSRRSQSPSPSLRNLNTTPPSTSKPPAKMVSVPATHKTNNAAGGGAVKRIHVKRNVSPARRTDLCVYTETRSQEQTKLQESNTRAPDQRRKSLVEIDNNATPSNTKITPTYASLLLEDIHNFHQKNTNRPATSSPAFAVPECVNKAYSILEAVADLNSNTRWRNPTTINSRKTAYSVPNCTTLALA